MNRPNSLHCQAVLVFITLLLSALSAQAANIPGVGEISEIPAFLPTMESVPATQPTPIDGTWSIREISKTVRIDRGRIYAVDSWTHLFVLRIQPGMVVVQNLRPTGPGEYAGFDLPLQGPATYRLTRDRTLRVQVQGMLGPVSLNFMPLTLDNPHWLDQALAEAGFGSTTPGHPAPGYQPPVYQPPGDPVAYQPPGYQPVSDTPPTPPSPPPVETLPPIQTLPEEESPAECMPVYQPETDEFGCR